jgi:predicted DNA helicase
MERILVEGLADERADDVAGPLPVEAFDEADVSNDQIGQIELDGSTATVEVDPDVKERVLDVMDDNHVGRARVSLHDLDSEGGDKRKRVHEYVDRYEHLVQMEREAEMRRHEHEIRSTTGPEREAKGRAMIDMKGIDEGSGLAGHEVKFVKRRRDEPLPETEIATGDLVMVSRDDPLRDDNPTGTVTKRTLWTIHVAFDEQPADFLFGEDLRLDLYVNDITYQRMLAALDQLRHAEGRLAQLRSTLLGIHTPEEPQAASVDTWQNEQLNESQRRAVQRALGAEDVHLIHGPPGTGKTTTAIEVIQQYVDRGQTVLATAASNTAVDNLVAFLVDRGVDAVRVGHPARVMPNLRDHTLDHRVQQTDAYQQAQQAREQAFKLKNEQDEHQYPSGRWRRGMSNDRIQQLARENRSARGVPAHKIRSMAEWLDLEARVDELFDEHDRLENEAIDQVLDEADVVCTTNSTSGSRMLEDRSFDVLVLDEATQATEPSALVPLTRAGKIVLAGDHRQLPPTVLEEEAAEQGLRQSLFERIADTHEHLLDLLDTQYRMHETIGQFSAQRFYDDQLAPHDSIRHHTLADLDVDLAGVDEAVARVLDPEHPVTLVATATIDAPEHTPPGSPSTENPREAEIVARIARGAIAAGLHPKDVAVITPYDAQKDRVNGLLDAPDLEVDTVDEFQGREKELIAISLVRSNERDQLGFLTDYRRLNVALTRAKRKLVVVGDTGTVTADPTYEAFVDHAHDVGRVIDA